MSDFKRFVVFDDKATDQERAHKLSVVRSLAKKLHAAKSGNAKATFDDDDEKEQPPQTLRLLCGARMQEEPLNFWNLQGAHKETCALVRTVFVHDEQRVGCLRDEDRHVPVRARAALHSGTEFPEWAMPKKKRQAKAKKNAAENGSGGDDDDEESALGEEPAVGDALEDFEENDEAELEGISKEEYADWDELGAEMGYTQSKKRKHAESEEEK